MDINEKRKFLQLIQSGNLPVEPSGDSEEELKAFQLVAQAWIQLREEGLITRFEDDPYFEHQTGKDYYIAIFPGNGLTERGRRLLESGE